MQRKIVRIALVAELCPPAGSGRGAVPVLVQFRYDTRDPFTVSLRFLARPGRWVTWSFARELISDALVCGQAGAGDVRFDAHPCSSGHLSLTLSSPSGRAEFKLARRPLAAALDATERLVPWGNEAEQIDWDTELARLREVA